MDNIISPEECESLLRTAVGPELPFTITTEMSSRLSHALLPYFEKAGIAAVLAKEEAKKLRKLPVGTCPQCKLLLRDVPYCAKTGLPHKGYSDGVPPMMRQNTTTSPEGAKATEMGSGALLGETPPSKATANGANNATAARGTEEATPLTVTTTQKKARKPEPTPPANVRSLMHFGFSYKKSTNQPTDAVESGGIPRPSLFFHDFEDNDDQRTMSLRWKALQKHSLLLESSSTDVVIDSLADSTPLHGFATHFATNTVAMMGYDVGENFDPELLLTVFSSHNHEEFEPRPAYYGTYNKKREAWKDMAIPWGRDIPLQAWIDDYDDSAQDWESEPEDADTCNSQRSSEPEKGNDEDDDLSEFLDEDEAVGLLDEDDEEDDSNDELQVQLQEEANQINRKKKSKKGGVVLTMTARAVTGEAACARVQPLWPMAMPPEGSSFTSQTSFFESVLSAKVVEKKLVEKTYFRSAAATAETVLPSCAASSEPMIPTSVSADAVRIFCEFLSQEEKSTFKKDIFLHYLLKEHPNLMSAKDAKVVMKCVAVWMKGKWTLKPPTEWKWSAVDPSSGDGNVVVPPTVGSVIEATWMGGKVFYKGKVEAVNSDNTVAIQFDDGDFEPRAALSTIKKGGPTQLPN